MVLKEKFRFFAMFNNQIVKFSDMRKIISYIGITLLTINTFTVKAQYEITTIKGDIYLTTAYKITTDNDYKELMYLDHKGKKRFLEYESIFTIQSPEKQSVVYRPQSENDYSFEEMKSIVNGRIAGKKTDKLWIPFTVSFAATTCTGFLDKGDFFMAPVVPLGTTISIGLFGWGTKPKFTDKSEFYENGYNEQRTFRMIKASLIGGGAGLLTGAAIHGIRNW